MKAIIQASLLAAVAAGIALPAQASDYNSKAIAMMKRDFHAKGIAKMDRLNADGLQVICTRTNNNPPKDIQARLEQDQAESIRYPANGKLMGEWKDGEKIAKSGRGMTWRDDPDPKKNGGGCYNCHQLSPQETSFGTIGPSLLAYGKTRGNGPDMQKYVYGKIYNSKASNLCSTMPRFGHSGTLTEEQIRDLVAYLLDPASPVNQ